MKVENLNKAERLKKRLEKVNSFIDIAKNADRIEIYSGRKWFRLDHMKYPSAPKGMLQWGLIENLLTEKNDILEEIEKLD